MASSADTRVCKTTDVDGNALELRAGDTVFDIAAHVTPRGGFYPGSQSSARIAAHTIIAVSPKGDRISFDPVMGRPYYTSVYQGTYATSFAQAKRALRSHVRGIVEGVRAELQRAEALQDALDEVTPEQPAVATADAPAVLTA